jgi:hypothetical protein
MAAIAALAARRFPAAVRPVRDRIARRRRPAHETWSCECGQVYRVSGAGRHRIYWPEGAPESEPLLTPECVNCERPLPTH